MRLFALLAITLALAALVVFGLSLWDPDLSHLRKTTEDQESLSAVLRNVGILVLGVLAIPLAVWRGWSADQQAKAAAEQVQAAQAQVQAAQRQVEASRHALLHERYQKGIEALGSDSATTRMAGVYALAALAADHDDEYHVQVLELLCAFVRNPPGLDRTGADYDWNPLHHIRVRRPPRKGFRRGKPFVPEADYLEALRYVTTQRPSELQSLESKQKFVRDLKAAEFPAGPIPRIHVPGADLSCVYACDSIWLNPDCNDTKLTFAVLCRARFIAGDFTDTDFGMADLNGAIFQGGSAINARFAGADLTGTQFSGCDLSGAWFSGDEAMDTPASGLSQEDLDHALADPNNPPTLDGVIDQKGRRIVWRGQPIRHSDRTPS